MSNSIDFSIVDVRATILDEKLEKKQKKKTHKFNMVVDCLRSREQRGRLSLYIKLRLYKNVFIVTIK